jgi:hypothetical protein
MEPQVLERAKAQRARRRGHESSGDQYDDRYSVLHFYLTSFTLEKQCEVYRSAFSEFLSRILRFEHRIRIFSHVIEPSPCLYMHATATRNRSVVQ